MELHIKGRAGKGRAGKGRAGKGRADKGRAGKGVLVKGVLGCHSSTKTSIILFLIGPIGHTRLLLAEGIGHISLLCPKVAACLHHVMVT